MKLTKYAGYFWVEPETAEERKALDDLAGEKVAVERWDAALKRLIERMKEPSPFALWAKGWKQGVNEARVRRGEPELE
ncbi:MAG TPA: hypothetical protein VFZ21_31690 [Gemmatimonadaceae bacterium]|nr:hypothetical protein [Gemmatimonadaceae bacterium]